LGVQDSRKFAFISAITGPQKFAVLANLASALAHNGSEVMLLDANHNKDSIRRRLPVTTTASLWDAAAHKTSIESLVNDVSTGVRWCQLSQAPLHELATQPAAINALSSVMTELSEKSNVWLVDIDHELDPPFVVPELNQAELIVLSSCQMTSIKKAYGLIKSLHTQLGRRPIQLIVYAATPTQAEVVHRNLAKAANEFLAISLLPLGNLPVDEDLARAMQMKRSVIEAFPISASANAFKKIAIRFMQTSIKKTQSNPLQSSHKNSSISQKGLENV
jgi:flagellar biosynthesis protein FlhG